jgi:hypothetical protein
METFVLTADAAARFDEAGIKAFDMVAIVRCTDTRTAEEWFELRSPEDGQPHYGDLGTTDTGVREVGAGLGRVDTICRQDDGTIAVTVRREPLPPVYSCRGISLPRDAVIFRSEAQASADNPWGTYVAVNPDGSIDLRGENLPIRNVESVSCRLPEERPDGSPLQEGDACTIWVYGESGSCPEDYVFRDGRWEYVHS